ncbi:MAG: hypothetical protein R2751_08460 [Bacteroidales bacterium]
MATKVEENQQNTGFVLGVLRSAEYLCHTRDQSDLAQELINVLLDGKMRYVFIKRLAKQNKIELDWNCFDITVKRTD